MRRLYIHSGGGLGDHISHYFGYPEWRTLKPIKEGFDVYVKLIIYSANLSVASFYDYHPYIDEIEFFDVHNNKQGEYQLRELSEGFEELASTDIHQSIVKDATERRTILEAPEIYLSPEEQETYKEITSQKFICIHPFAGTLDRLTLDKTHIRLLVDRLIEDLGLNVVVIGGTWGLTDFHSTPNNKMSAILTEEFNYKRDGLINLVNKTSTRLSTKISMQASGFIGNYSGPILAAWIAKIKSVCYVSSAVGKVSPQDTAPYTIAGWPILWQLPFSKEILFDDDTVQAEVIDDTVSWLKEDIPCKGCSLWAPWGIRKIF